MTEPGVASGEREVHTPDGVQAGAAADALAPAGYGARLAWERERAGLGVTDVAARLRLHPDQVRAIEQENLARLPEPAYVRGFIRGYARALNIDPLPIVTDLNAKLAPVPASEADDAGARYDVERGAGHEGSARWVVGIAVVGLAVLGWVGWQTTQRDAQTQAAPVAILPVAPPPPSVASATDLVPAPVVVEPAPASPETAVPKAAEPESMAASTPTAAPSASAPVPTLMLRFTGASWVEVTDSAGKVLLSQLSTPGAEHALEGELPLNVLIGDATKTSVEVRGAAFNLLPITRNNVARFTVK